MKRYLITTALPYINGVIHIGHIYELYISYIYYVVLKKYYSPILSIGLDCHGLIKKNNLLKIDFLNKKKYIYHNFYFFYDKTNNFINKRISNWIYAFLNDKNFLYSKSTNRFYNNKKNFFIPDKYLKINCINCNNLIENYYCIYCKKEVSSFIILKKENLILKKINSIFLKNFIFNDWDFSRNKIYNGIKIISKKNIFFYVWYDAIISYISNNIKHIKKNYSNLILQIIGKDIIYYHKIFNIILNILYIKKTKIIIHNFLTLNNKISKSNHILIKKDKSFIIKFFFMINNNLKKDIIYNVILIKNLYKKIFFNKIINLFFRIRAFFNIFDNKFLDIFFKKKNVDYYFLKKKKINIFLKKTLLNILIINKKLDLNKFWNKKNKYLIHHYYSKTIYNYLINLNFIFKILNNKTIKKKINNNCLIFNLKKFNEI
ncbi:class I tRNA ligase family protein [Candidatus Carsonella ruddii]|uniref:Methionyl-tRNA synthetase n=1 Tax=Candidatus Carsonella ruddii (Diaphorina cf. continua) TaxID=2661587 RepID=A0A7R7ACG7_CARRU|nr:class I tRNA ligase family protein [Candidatus Carsonella ruddii (Diaphorina cf. continua)]BCG49339.1 methionine--tRNA ligase [Candidatus Carsonella ruddii (Diaphorina cf. continua)]